MAPTGAGWDRESRTIMRYICNKHKLEAWYPAEAQARAWVDLQLDWHAGTLYPCLRTHIYPKVSPRHTASSPVLASARRRAAPR